MTRFRPSGDLLFAGGLALLAVSLVGTVTALAPLSWPLFWAGLLCAFVGLVLVVASWRADAAGTLGTVGFVGGLMFLFVGVFGAFQGPSVYPFLLLAAAGLVLSLVGLALLAIRGRASDAL